MRSAIRIWPWDGAPKKYKRLSMHGGDEDFVVLLRGLDGPGEDEMRCVLIDKITVCDASRHVMSNGDVVYITAHA